MKKSVRSFCVIAVLLLVVGLTCSSCLPNWGSEEVPAVSGEITEWPEAEETGISAESAEPEVPVMSEAASAVPEAKAAGIGEEFAEALQIAIEEDIWFRGESAFFYSFLNGYVEYEYYYNRKDGTMTILTRADNDDPDKYYLIQFLLRDRGTKYKIELSGLTQSMLYEYNYKKHIEWMIRDAEYDDLKSVMPPEPTGVDTIQIGEARKPEYDTSETELKEAIRSCMEFFNQTLNARNSCSNIYIRNSYKNARGTIILYTYYGRDYYTYADLKRGIVYEPNWIDDEGGRFYTERLKECAYQADASDYGQ